MATPTIHFVLDDEDLAVIHAALDPELRFFPEAFRALTVALARVEAGQTRPTMDLERPRAVVFRDWLVARRHQASAFARACQAVDRALRIQDRPRPADGR